MPLTILFGICLLRTAPQDLPDSRAWLFGALAGYLAADIITVLDIYALEQAVPAAVVDTLLLAAATNLVLQWRGLNNRVTQTLTALAGCGALLSLLAWAVAGLARELFQPEWVWAAFLVWYVLAFGHVLRHALSITFTAGVGAGFAYIILSMGVTGLFITPTAAGN